MRERERERRGREMSGGERIRMVEERIRMKLRYFLVA